VAEALFEPDGDARFVPSDMTRGPWSPDAMHGGAVAALLARHAEAAGAVVAPGPMHPARLTVELLRPLTLQPLTVRADVVRPGRKVQWVDAELTDDDGNRMAAARLLRIRTAPVDVPSWERVPPPPPPSAGTPSTVNPAVADYDAFHNVGVEHRYVMGGFDVPGPATDWIRLRVPVVPDGEPTPLERVAAAADFGNGVAAPAFFWELRFLNADLSIHLHRLPAGEWVCLDSVVRLSDDGVAVAESDLYDEGGAIGRSLQSLLLEPGAGRG
jgi:acyl-coenzyme A thioesterase PaaI-like protein